MTDIFYYDITNDLAVTWDDLIFDLKHVRNYSSLCYQSDYYGVFRQIVLSVLLDKNITLLDPGFTQQEISRLTGNIIPDEIDNIAEAFEITNCKTKEDLLSLLKRNHQNWSITLFTSGTTGLPKSVGHSFGAITRYVKCNDKNKSDVWGFAYNPASMAGLQVFFQALLNGNTIIRLYGVPQNLLLKAVREAGITHISSTPSFYRLLLPNTEQFHKVRRITSGGEKFDTNTAEQLKAIFPNAKITNIYASTEAGTLLASEGNIFSIKPDLKGLIKIEDDELLVHKKLMGHTNIKIDEWYHTGDIVEILSGDPLKFQFVSRRNDLINVGGYKVNPYEVEEIIREIEGVREVKVYGRKSSLLGNVVCCDIVRNNTILEEPDVRRYLDGKIQEYKIPRMITFVNEIITTRTGKIKRN